MPEIMQQYIEKIIHQLNNPWVWFGFVAQGLFFLRFLVQWIVSERRKRSTIPLVFWYFSLGGALLTFIYAAGQTRPDLPIMAGQVLACVIYIRNLMLIRSQAERRRLAGLPSEPDASQ